MDSFIPSIPGLGSLGRFHAVGACGHQVKDSVELGRDDTVSDIQLTIQAGSLYFSENQEAWKHSSLTCDHNWLFEEKEEAKATAFTWMFSVLVRSLISKNLDVHIPASTLYVSGPISSLNILFCARPFASALQTTAVCKAQRMIARWLCVVLAPLKGLAASYALLTFVLMMGERSRYQVHTFLL